MLDTCIQYVIKLYLRYKKYPQTRAFHTGGAVEQLAVSMASVPVRLDKLILLNLEMRKRPISILALLQAFNDTANTTISSCSRPDASEYSTHFKSERRSNVTGGKAMQY